MAEGEASAIAFMLLEKVAGLSRLQVLTGDADPPDADRLADMARRVAEGTPVQYVVGSCDFCGLTFHVEPSVLIPRPETEELVDWVCSALPPQPAAPSILDVGTGSGCIAVSLAKRLSGARVAASDISEDALRVARRNAAAHHVSIDFVCHDILADPPAALSPQSLPCFDVVVSNPPYICEEEARQMERNVLDHEPHLALFVPDQSPLLFYEAIARRALSLLRGGGSVFFEINRRFGADVVSLLRCLGYTHVELRQDQFGNDRMIRAVTGC